MLRLIKEGADVDGITGGMSLLHWATVCGSSTTVVIVRVFPQASTTSLPPPLAVLPHLGTAACLSAGLLSPRLLSTP